ncbi:hypothetical protein, partial [Pseudoclavibacter caeni]|uniref:hypothetical protein n=1 Tax=Pseudoclavibacter caeni TaxID=908846 RepID=UPI001CE46257
VLSQDQTLRRKSDRLQHTTTRKPWHAKPKEITQTNQAKTQPAEDKIGIDMCTLLSSQGSDTPTITTQTNQAATCQRNFSSIPHLLNFATRLKPCRSESM